MSLGRTAGAALVALGLAIAAYRALGLGGPLTSLALRVGSEAIGRAGYGGLLGLMALESAAVPIPSEVVVPLAGLRYSTPLGLALVTLASTAGNVLGSMALYMIAARGGRPVLTRYGSAVGLSNELLRRAEELFAGRGGSVVLVGRVLPGVRSVISAPAGLFRMPMVRFIAFTVIGSLPWNAALAVAGARLGQLALSLPWSDYAAAAVAVAMGLALLLRPS